MSDWSLDEFGNLRSVAMKSVLARKDLAVIGPFDQRAASTVLFN